MNRNNGNRMKKIKVVSYQTIQSKNRSGSAEPRRKVEIKSRNNANYLHVDRNHSFEGRDIDKNGARENDKLSSNKKKEKKYNTNKKNTRIKTLENSSKKNTLTSTMKTKKDKEKTTKTYNANRSNLESKEKEDEYNSLKIKNEELGSQNKLLIQENENLKKELDEISSKKDEEISELRQKYEKDTKFKLEKIKELEEIINSNGEEDSENNKIAKYMDENLKLKEENSEINEKNKKLEKEIDELKSLKEESEKKENENEEVSKLKEMNENLENKLKEQNNVVNVYAQYIEAYKAKLLEFDTYVKQVNAQHEEERKNYLKEIELLKGKVAENEKENKEN